MDNGARRWLVAAIAFGAAAFTRPAAADEIIRPCKPGTPEHTAAGKALDHLDAEIRKLAPGADPEPLKKHLGDLAAQACFRIVDLDADAKSGLALRTWWEDGGHDVAASALELAGKEPYLWIAPDMRRALTIETAPHHRLAPLLCPAYDEKCGRDTDGWRLRAEAAFERAARARHLEGNAAGPFLAEWTRDRLPTTDDCAKYAQSAPRRRQLVRFRNCLDATAERSPRFPVGRVKKPTEGWLIVSGRRGHYQFCDEVRAFDLATGSAYRVGSCSGLALMSGGAVDHRATDAARKTDRERGTVSIEEIREAAWMLLQLGEVDPSVLTSASGHALPGSIALESDGDAMEGLGLGGMSWSSGQTSLEWRVTAATRELGSGTITWPRDLNDDIEAYATELLEVAEASFTPGCPIAAPPAALTQPVKKLSVNRLDGDAKSVRDAASTLDAGWRDLLRDRCSTVRRRARR